MTAQVNAVTVALSVLNYIFKSRFVKNSIHFHASKGCDMTTGLC